MLTSFAPRRSDRRAFPARFVWLLSVLLIGLAVPAYAQLGIGTTTPDASAVVEFSSTSKGLLVPRMTQAQRTTISAPAVGLLVYQTDGSAGFYFYSAGGWTWLNPLGGADNLGNHTATQNLNLSTYQLVGNGGTSGFQISSTGRLQFDGTRVIIGLNSGNDVMTGNDNILIGNSVGGQVASGGLNTSIGTYSAFNLTTGGLNVFTGYNAGSSTTTGAGNVFVGPGSGDTNVTGSNNTAIGSDADVDAPGLFNATAIGNQAKVSQSNSLVLGGTGVDAVKVGIGTTAPQATLHVEGSTSTVRFAGLAGTGTRVVTTDAAGNLSTTTTASLADNLGNHTATQDLSLNAYKLTGTGSSVSGVGIGIRSDGGLNLGQNTTGNNIGVGYQAGAGASGSGSTALGYQAGAGSGSYNLFVGYQAGLSNTSGSRNQFLGYRSGLSNETGQHNTFVGYASGQENYNGSFNTYVGHNTGNANTYGSSNTAVGYGAGPSTDGLTNTTALGNSASVSQSNSLILGGTGTNAVKVGIGTTAPAATLHVAGNTSTVRVEGMAGTGTRLATAGTTGTLAASNTLDLSSFKLQAQNSTALGDTTGVVQLYGNTDDVGAALVAYGNEDGAAATTGSRYSRAILAGYGRTTEGSASNLLDVGVWGHVYNSTSGYGVVASFGNNPNQPEKWVGLANESTALRIVDGNEAVGRVLTSDDDGNASWQAVPGSADNLGNHTATQDLNLNGNFLTGGGTSGLTVTSAGKVGIGTNNPLAALHVSGATPSVRFDGLAGNDTRVVTADMFGDLATTSIASLGDNLGNHTATQKLNLAAFKLVGNGGSTGLSISSAGAVTTDGALTTGGAITVGGKVDLGTNSLVGNGGTVGLSISSAGVTTTGGNINLAANRLVGNGGTSGLYITSAGLIGVGAITSTGGSAQLANTTTNTLGSDGQGCNSTSGVGSLNWAMSTNGYAGAFYNGSTLSNGNGLAVKVDGTNSSASVLDVSKGSQGSTGTSLLMVKAGGFVGIGTSSPATHLDVDGALTTRDNGATTSLTADNQTVTIGDRTYVRLTSDAAAATSRTVVLADGLRSGQWLIIENAGASNNFEVGDGGTTNANTNGSVSLGPGDTITLIWNGTDWIELNHSNN